MRRLAAIVVMGLVALPGAADAAAPDRVPLAQFKPLPAASKVHPSAAAQALRKKLLGNRAFDRDYATLHWVGVSSFIVTLEGHLFLFDAWEVTGANKDYVPIGREELAGIEPEAILLGHGHFDHAADVGYVSGRSGAPVLASQEQCDTVKEDAAGEGNAGKFTCVLTGSQDTPAFGALTQVKLFEDVRPVTLLKGVHSNTRPPGGGNRVDPFLPVFDPAPYIEHPQTSPEELTRFLSSLEDPEGGTRMYHFRVGDFSLLVGDSAGPIFEHPKIRASLDALPDCVDVMTNAILGFDQPVSGLQDPVAYVAAVHPKLFLPTHADAWAPALSAGQAAYRDQLRTELGRLSNPPQIDHLLDPRDYVKQRAYRVADARWKPPPPGSSCARRAAARRERCVPRRLAVSGVRIGPARIGRSVKALSARYRVLRRSGRATRLCLRGRGRFLVGARKGRIDLVATTAAGHRTRRFGPGRRASRVTGARRVAGGLLVGHRLGGGRVVYGLRGGRVRFLAVVARRALERPRSLARRLARLGLRVRSRRHG